MHHKARGRTARKRCQLNFELKKTPFESVVGHPRSRIIIYIYPEGFVAGLRVPDFVIRRVKFNFANRFGTPCPLHRACIMRCTFACILYANVVPVLLSWTGASYGPVYRPLLLGRAFKSRETFDCAEHRVPCMNLHSNVTQHFPQSGVLTGKTRLWIRTERKSQRMGESILSDENKISKSI